MFKFDFTHRRPPHLEHLYSIDSALISLLQLMHDKLSGSRIYDNL
ncbi:MAG: hypothetical protein ACTSPD_04875 [Promethearchaeota archaeon]